MVFAGRPLVVRFLLRPPEGQVSTLLLWLLKEMGGLALMLAVFLWLAARDPVRNLAIVDGLIAGLCILAMTPVVSLWSDRHSKSVPCLSDLGTIRGAASHCRPALLAPTTRESVGTRREFLTANIAWAGQDVAGLTPLRFGRPETEETVKTLGAVLTLPQENSIVPKAVWSNATR
jgi:hypothetical protein